MKKEATPRRRAPRITGSHEAEPPRQNIYSQVSACQISGLGDQVGAGKRGHLFPIGETGCNQECGGPIPLLRPNRSGVETQGSPLRVPFLDNSTRRKRRRTRLSPSSSLLPSPDPVQSSSSPRWIRHRTRETPTRRRAADLLFPWQRKPGTSPGVVGIDRPCRGGRRWGA